VLFSFYEHAHFVEPAIEMRITAEAKTATRQRILTVAAQLFQKQGWESATTRDIATGAGIANGTLFNYFPSKEAIAAALIEDALAGSYKEFSRRRTGQESLEEDLFSLVWTGLKGLRKSRKFLAPAVEAIFSPLAQPSRAEAGASVRIRHLETVEQIMVDHGISRPLPAVVQQLYWTLHLGVFAYWAADDSPNQEDTLALLDRSLKLFAGSFRNHNPADGERVEPTAEGELNHERKSE
jgi:AcrR family transcriptional regulator